MPLVRATWAPSQGTALFAGVPRIFFNLPLAYDAAMDVYGIVSEVARILHYTVAEVRSTTRSSACWRAVFLRKMKGGSCLVERDCWGESLRYWCFVSQHTHVLVVPAWLALTPAALSRAHVPWGDFSRSVDVVSPAEVQCTRSHETISSEYTSCHSRRLCGSAGPVRATRFQVSHLGMQVWRDGARGQTDTLPCLVAHPGIHSGDRGKPRDLTVRNLERGRKEQCMARLLRASPLGVGRRVPSDAP